MTAFSGTMTTWVFPDAISTATPLAMISKGNLDGLPSYLQMFLGYRGGCLGETCTLALLLGGVYLLVKRVISWHTPVAFIGTVAVMSLVCGKDVLYQLMAGGLMIGALFMATDYVTSPITKPGRLLFGISCGLLTGLFRVFSSSAEGVIMPLVWKEA